jgi:hypothetical protein
MACRHTGPRRLAFNQCRNTVPRLSVVAAHDPAAHRMRRFAAPQRWLEKFNHISVQRACEALQKFDVGFSRPCSSRIGAFNPCFQSKFALRETAFGTEPSQLEATRAYAVRCRNRSVKLTNFAKTQSERPKLFGGL